MRALVKAARSIVLYEAGNQAVAGFLAEFHQRITDYLARNGELDLVFKPYEVSSRGEVIYAERDLERSLAVRLYSDGVRRLTIDASAPWQELTRLVGILAVRFKGIRQQEDDVVTLLWKADLEHVHLEAVAGFVAADPDDEIAHETPDGMVAPRNELQARIFAAPYSFPYPAPEPAEPVRPQYRPLPAEKTSKLTNESSDETLPEECLNLARSMLEGGNGGSVSLPPDAVAAFLREMRDGLLAMGRAEAVVSLALLAARTPTGDPAAREVIMEACLDRRTLEAILAGSGPAISRAALQELAGTLAGEQVTWLLETVAKEGLSSSAERRAFLAAALADKAHLIRPWLDSATPPGTVALLQLLTGLRPEEGATAAADLLARQDATVQRAALATLGAAPYSPKIGRALTAGLAAQEEEIRLGALQLLVRNRETRALQAVRQRIEHLATGTFSPREASNLGAAMALLAPAEALKTFAEWVRPSGLLQRVVSRPPALLWAAGGGLAKLGGAESDALLERLAGHGPEELQQRCRAILERRRSGGGGE